MTTSQSPPYDIIIIKAAGANSDWFIRNGVVVVQGMRLGGAVICILESTKLRFEEMEAQLINRSFNVGLRPNSKLPNVILQSTSKANVEEPPELVFLLQHLKLIWEKSIVKAMVVMKMVVMASVSDDCQELELGETQYLFLRLWFVHRAFRLGHFDDLTLFTGLFAFVPTSFALFCSEFRLLCVEVRLQTGRLMDFQRLRSEVVKPDQKEITMGLGIILGMVDVGLAEEEWLHFIKIPHGQVVLHPEQDEVFTIHESAKEGVFYEGLSCRCSCLGRMMVSSLQDGVDVANAFAKMRGTFIGKLKSISLYFIVKVEHTCRYGGVRDCNKQTVECDSSDL
ncbi:hypothetical protein ACFE04_031264 [Oxalis oulophora]